jgi:hypothetical protein
MPHFIVRLRVNAATEAQATVPAGLALPWLGVSLLVVAIALGAALMAAR